MLKNAIIIIIFLILLAIISLVMKKKFKNAYLDKLSLLPGEKVLFEEDGIKTLTRTVMRGSLYPKSIVRVTNQRIIIAQKMLFNKTSMPIRFVIHYHVDVAIPVGFAGGALKNGYVTFAIKKENVEVVNIGEKEYLEIKPPQLSGGARELPISVRIYSVHPNDYLKLFP